MKGFHEAVTHEQMQAACAALGLPLDQVFGVSMDVSGGVDVSLYVTDCRGRKLVHCGAAVVTAIHIPIGPAGEVPDAAPDE